MKNVAERNLMTIFEQLIFSLHISLAGEKPKRGLHFLYPGINLLCYIYIEDTIAKGPHTHTHRTSNTEEQLRK